MKLVVVLRGPVEEEASRRASTNVLLFIEVHHLLSNVLIGNLQTNKAFTACFTAPQSRLCLVFGPACALFGERFGLAFVLTCTAFPPIHIIIHINK